MAKRKRFSVKNSRLKNLSKKQKIILAVAIVLVLGGIATALWFYFNSNNDDSAVDITETTYYSPLTGVETSKEKTKKPVTAAMIENSPDARPQSGLKKAGVVFEAVAEGGITRFIALYQESEPELIGPVRSLRSYFVEWAAAYDPAVAHVGGSGDALEKIQSGDYGVDLDQFYNAEGYWRADDRYAPHNMYTNSKHLTMLEESKDKKNSDFTSWQRQDGKRVEPPTKSNNKDEEEEQVKDENTYADFIVMPVSTGQFQVGYQYDPVTNTYLRSQGGEEHIDREDGQIAPDTVIAMMVSMNLGSDGLHNEINLSGSGDVFIFQNGILTKGKWDKNSATDQIKFTDNDGEEIKINRGQTWVTAVPNNNTVTWQ